MAQLGCVMAEKLASYAASVKELVSTSRSECITRSCNPSQRWASFCGCSHDSASTSLPQG